MATQSDRQKRIIEHLARCGGYFSIPKLDSVERKQRILEHVRLTRG